MIVKTVGKSCKNGAQIWGLQCSSSSLSSVVIILCDVSCCFPISISVAWSAAHQARVWGGELCWDIWDKGQPHIQGVSQNCLHLVFWHFISQNSSKKQKPMPNWKVVHYDQARGGQPEPEVLWDTLYKLYNYLYKLSSVSDRSCHEWQSIAYVPLLILQTFSALINLFIVSC